MESLQQSLPLNTSILLTVAGMSKCIEFEAYSSIQALPGWTGVGLAFAFNVPVVLRVCGLGTLTIGEDVEVKVSGPGIRYSTPLLGSLLETIGLEAYSRDELTLAIALEAVGESEALAAALASLEGSLAVIGRSVKPLYSLEGLSAVVARLHTPLEDMPARLASVSDVVAALTARLLDEEYWFNELSLLLSTLLPDDIRAACSKALCFPDYSGKLLAVLVDSDEAIDVASSLSRYGETVVAEPVVPPI